MAIKSQELKRYDYFSSLTDEVLEALAGRIRTVNFPAGEYVVREGTPGESFYFVGEGELEVTKRGSSGHEARISVLKSGQGFGEMALLTTSARSCSVRAISNLVLYELAKADFETIILEAASFRDQLKKTVSAYAEFNRIKTLQPFELLPLEKMCAVLEKMDEKTYQPGDDIIVQGEKGDNYYIIKSGRVAVLKKKKGESQSAKIAELGEGEAFGEEALIRDDPRNATCRAMDETTVLVLGKRDFENIVKSAFLENIFPEDIGLDSYMDDYMIIDVRIPAEYAEEHIMGAVNIPIEELRLRCKEFDTGRKYVTYCLNDSRGMVGAFLLKNRGFDASCLRGGVSGWLGELVTGSDGVHMPKG